MTVVDAPSYFARHPKPQHPRDLVEHACLNWHAAAGVPAYRWEFTEPGPKDTKGGRELVVAVSAPETDAEVPAEADERPACAEAARRR